MKNIVLNTVMWLLLPLLSIAQSPLSVGDKVPDFEFQQLINYHSPTAKLSDFNGKLVLIDFWETSCSNCIMALPKIDSLQRKFSDKMQVFSATVLGKETEIRNALKRYKNLEGSILPIALGAHNVKKMFPHQLISHVVWIGGDGIVKAITGTEYVTYSNIEQVINGEKINWPVKRDVFGFDYDKPLTIYAHRGNVPKALYSSAFSGYIEGIDGMDNLSTDTANGTITGNHFNHTLFQLIAGSITGEGNGMVDAKHMILEVTDSSRYIRGNTPALAWDKTHTFCYSYTLPMSLSDTERRKFIQQDLNKWLQTIGVYAKLEKRRQKVWVIKKISNDYSRLRSKGGPTRYALEEKVKVLRNSPFSNLQWHLNQNVPGIPWVFDETKIPLDFMADMELNINSFANLPALKKALKPYGLDIEEAERELDMYVITDKKSI